MSEVKKPPTAGAMPTTAGQRQPSSSTSANVEKAPHTTSQSTKVETSKTEAEPSPAGQRPRLAAVSKRPGKDAEAAPKATKGEASGKEAKPTDPSSHKVERKAEKSLEPAIKARPGKSGRVLKVVQLKGTVGEKEVAERVLATLPTTE